MLLLRKEEKKWKFADYDLTYSPHMIPINLLTSLANTER
jgi:hypothetical protein